MDIGKEIRTIEIQPAVEPVPQRERTAPSPATRPAIPRKEPAKPGKSPTRKPVKSPSR